MSSIEEYVINLSTPEDSLLRELDRVTNLRVVQPRMISGHLQGRLLEFIAKMVRAKKILEIGTFTGYSTLSLAAGLELDGVLDTVEVNDELESIASSFFKRSEHGSKIRQHIGSALEIVPRLGEIYDLIFIDGDKREYAEYLKMLMGDEFNGGIFAQDQSRSQCEPSVRSGTIIVADNILWYGKVAEPEHQNDHYTKCIDQFNRLVISDKRLENIILPIRDGLNVIRVL